MLRTSTTDPVTLRSPEQGAIASIPCLPAEVDDFLSKPTAAVSAMLDRMPGDFMVLDAAGKMGLHVCLMLRRALDANHDKRRVIAVARFSKAEARAEFESRSIETLPCDLCDGNQLARFPDARNIIFMAGAKFGIADNPGLLKQMNEDMSAMVAERFAHSRITAFSNGCVYLFQQVDSEGASEISETNPIGTYAISCFGREMAFS